MYRLILRAAAALLSVVIAAAPAAADDREMCRGVGDQAIAACSRLIGQNPKDSIAFHNRGSHYAAKGEYDRAIADFRLDPGNASGYDNRGLIYAKRGDQDHAIADYDQAIILNPAYAFAYDDRGLAYAAKGDHDRAIADYDQAIKRNPNFALAYLHRGSAYEAKGDYNRAMADYDQARKLSPSLTPPRPGRSGMQPASDVAFAPAAPTDANARVDRPVQPGDDITTGVLRHPRARSPSRLAATVSFDSDSPDATIE